MATVDEIKAQIHEEVDAFVVAVDLLLAELRAPEPPATPTPVARAATDTPSGEADAPAAPSGVNEAQQNIIEPTPDPTPEEESEGSSQTSPSPAGGSAPDTTGL